MGIVIGTATDGRITDESGTFQVLHEARSTVQLLQGLVGGVGLALVGVVAAYGTFNWLQQLGRKLLAVVAFIA